MFKELLKGDHISLKKHSLELAQTMFEYVDQDRERLRKFLPWVEFTKTVNDEVNYIQMTHDNWDEGKLFDYGIFNSEGVYVGNIGAHSIRWQDDACELGYWILGKYEGLGLMSRAVELLESHIFSLGFNRIQIRCSDLNARSARVPENTGYVYEGTARQDAVEMGAYRNTKTFSKLRSEHIA